MALVAALILAPAATAATLTVNDRCYQELQDVVVSGTGFKPSSIVAITRDGAPVGSAATDPGGSFVGKFTSQELRLPAKEELYDLAATDGQTIAVTRYRVTKVFADFFPGSGDPATLRVRFTINGFALLRRRPSVFLHYVDPRGRLRKTVRLGRARGSCGKIRRTAERRLFPFRARRGRWILQFDTNKRYRRGTQRSSFVWVRKPVRVFPRGR